MNLDDLYKEAFDDTARDQLEQIVSWIPAELHPHSDLSPAEKDLLFADFVKFKQRIVSAALNSLYKVSNVTVGATKDTISECVTAVTKGAAKTANEEWFLEQLDKSRLSHVTVTSRIDHLINTFCVPRLALPADLETVKQECEIALRTKRIDFKQKLRKAYRKILKDSPPLSLDLFHRQVVEGVYIGMSNAVPEDIEEAFNGIPKGAVEFFRLIALDALEGDTLEKYPFLAHSLSMDEDTDSEIGFREEEVELDPTKTPKKRSHVDTPSTAGEGDAKKRLKRTSSADQRTK